MGDNIEMGECAKILVQSLFDSYDQLIINLSNNIEILVFDDITAVIFEEENWYKSKEVKLRTTQ